MAFVRDSDIRRILEKLASGNPLSVTIHPPFIYEGLKGYRHFDKEYSLDGLTVFLEAVFWGKNMTTVQMTSL